MKEGRRAGGITAGPESKVLDGPTWDEARQMQMEGKTVVDHGVDFRVGAASKGIIQRDFQHHATVFKSAYAKNPFDNISEDELAEYKRIIDAKSRGDGNSNFFILDNCLELLSKFNFDFSVTDSSLADGGPNSTFEGDDATSPPTTAVGGAGDNNTLSPVLSPTSDTEHTTGSPLLTLLTIIFFSFLTNFFSFLLFASKKSLRCPLGYLSYLYAITNTLVYANLGEGFGVI